MKKLLVLQERQARLSEAAQEIAQAPEEIADLSGRFEQRTKTLEKHRHEARQIETERKKLEMDAAALDGQIAKFANQRLLTRKQDEYQALEHEIEAARAKISTLDDRQLELMENYEAALRTLKEEEAEHAAIGKKVREQIAAFEARAVAAKERIAGLREARDAAREGIEPEHLSRFEHLIKNKGDIAVAKVDHGKNCGGCHMILSPQTLSTARGGERIAHCEHCGRFLFVPES